MYFDTSLETSRRDYSILSSPGELSWKGTFFSVYRVSFLKRRGLETGREETCEYKCNTRSVLLRIWTLWLNCHRCLHTRTRRKGFGLPFRTILTGGMTVLQWQLWTRARASNSTLAGAHNAARLLTGSVKTTTGSSWFCCWCHLNCYCESRYTKCAGDDGVVRTGQNSHKSRKQVCSGHGPWYKPREIDHMSQLWGYTLCVTW